MTQVLTSADCGATSGAQQMVKAEPESAPVSFASCAQARAAGRFNIMVGDPDYSLKLDGNKDGIACPA